MTKIAISAAGVSQADLLLKALIILPERAVITFEVGEGLLLIKDDYAKAALAHLMNAGLHPEVVKQ
jgi:hypothetical protein